MIVLNKLVEHEKEKNFVKQQILEAVHDMEMHMHTYTHHLENYGFENEKKKNKTKPHTKL